MVTQVQGGAGGDFTGVLRAAGLVAFLVAGAPAWASDDDSLKGTSSDYGSSGVASDILYLAGTVGCSKAKLDARDVSDFDSGAATSGDSTECLHLIDASVGIQFHKNIALEAGYKNVGKFHAQATGTELGVPISESASYKATGWHASLVGTIPLGQKFDLLGRLGTFNWRWRLNSNGVEGGVPFVRHETTTGSGVTYGVGLQYAFSKRLGGRLEWQRFDRVGKQSINGQTNIDALTFGLVYRF